MRTGASGSASVRSQDTIGQLFFVIVSSWRKPAAAHHRRDRGLPLTIPSWPRVTACAASPSPLSAASTAVRQNARSGAMRPDYRAVAGKMTGGENGSSGKTTIFTLCARTAARTFQGTDRHSTATPARRVPAESTKTMNKKLKLLRAGSLYRRGSNCQKPCARIIG